MSNIIEVEIVKQEVTYKKLNRQINQTRYNLYMADGTVGHIDIRDLEVRRFHRRGGPYYEVEVAKIDQESLQEHGFNIGHVMYWKVVCVTPVAELVERTTKTTRRKHVRRGIWPFRWTDIVEDIVTDYYEFWVNIENLHKYTFDN